MEVLGIDVAVVAGLSVFVLGLIQWFKDDKFNVWLTRLASFVLSFVIVAVFMLLNPLTWQEFIVYGVAVFLGANGIWHGADQVGRSVNKT